MPAAKKMAAPARREMPSFDTGAYEVEAEEAAPLFSLAPPPAPMPAPLPLRWLRLEIAPGLELNLREDFSFPRSSTERQALLDEVARQIDAATQG
jgi:hypothetical protein